MTPETEISIGLPRALGFAGLIHFVVLAFLVNTFGAHEDFLGMRFLLTARASCRSSAPCTGGYGWALRRHKRVRTAPWAGAWFPRWRPGSCWLSILALRWAQWLRY
jgi:hypothetical protein